LEANTLPRPSSQYTVLRVLHQCTSIQPKTLSQWASNSLQHQAYDTHVNFKLPARGRHGKSLPPWRFHIHYLFFPKNHSTPLCWRKAVRTPRTHYLQKKAAGHCGSIAPFPSIPGSATLVDENTGEKSNDRLRSWRRYGRWAPGCQSGLASDIRFAQRQCILRTPSNTENQHHSVPCLYWRRSPDCVRPQTTHRSGRSFTPFRRSSRSREFVTGRVAFPIPSFEQNHSRGTVRLNLRKAPIPPLPSRRGHRPGV